MVTRKESFVALQNPHRVIYPSGSAFSFIESASFGGHDEAHPVPHIAPSLSHCNLSPARHACSYCGKGFDRLDNCKRHERIHTNDKPYYCSLCPKRFITKQGLQYHLKLSTEHGGLATGANS